jgi:hypothetical protein
MSMKSDEMTDYIKSLRNDSVFSGDEDLLPKELYHICGIYEHDAEEYYSAKAQRTGM